MTDKPREDTLVSPGFTILEFGDGYIAMLQGAIEGKDDEGREIVDFVIKPSDLLRKRYNIKESMLDQNRNIPFRVFKKDLIPLNQFDDANRKWLYIKTFTYEETEISRIGWNLRSRLEEMEKRVMILEGELIWLSEQLQLAKSNPTEFLTQGFEIFDKYSSKILEFGKNRRSGEDS